MMQKNRHAIPQCIALALFVSFWTIGAGCGAYDGEADESATVVQLVYWDLDHDGDMDLGFTTRSDDAFVSTLLLNEGAGNFTVQQNRPTVTTTAGGQVELNPPDAWVEAGEENIGVLEGGIVGLSQAIEMLTNDRREALGVDDGVRAQGYYDCPASFACGFEHANWGGGWYGVAVNYNVPNLGFTQFGNWNDKFSSIRNRGWCWVDWWEHAYYSGDHYGQSPGNDNPWIGSYWNDKFSAIHWGLGC